MKNILFQDGIPLTTDINKFRTTNPAIGTKCVVGLARDGVLNFEVTPAVTRPEQFNPIPGSLEAVADMRHKGYKIVIITAQPGIGRGHMTIQDVENTHMYMLDLLGKAGCPSIDGIYYSSGTTKQDPYVKPGVGMFKRAEEHNKSIKFDQGFYVGHTIADLKAALKIGARPVLVRTGRGAETEKELNKYAYKDIKEKTYIFDDLAEFTANLE